MQHCVSWQRTANAWRVPAPQTHRVCAVCRCTANGQGSISYEDDAESGLGKLRYNKREAELPEELRGRYCRGSQAVQRLQLSCSVWLEQLQLSQLSACLHTGLEITDDGFLIDTKTGKVINEFGATR